MPSNAPRDRLPRYCNHTSLAECYSIRPSVIHTSVREACKAAMEHGVGIIHSALESTPIFNPVRFSVCIQHVKC